MASKYFNSDTIAAILTGGNTVSALGVIRVSGESAWAAVQPLLRRLGNGGSFSADEVESHRMYRCRVADLSGRTLDDGMFVWMKAPHSFTGEDAIELHLHGSPLLLRNVMQELFSAGAREALPGEFSFRAFQNGKLTLDQAESVADLISARSEESSRRALNQLLGKSKAVLEKLKRELVDRLAEIEIDIDFSDQGLSVLDADSWARKLRVWCEQVELIRKDYRDSRPLREGIRLAFVGQPNSGKSSLFNRLLGEERSIVSQEAGTTRDVVRESIFLQGLLFRLSDTAGIRETKSGVEAEGIARSFGELSTAQLVLWIFDGSNCLISLDKISSQWVGLQAHLDQNARVVAVWNKLDQGKKPDSAWESFHREKGIPTVAVSAKTGEGIDLLIEKILNSFRGSSGEGPDFWIGRLRHYEVLGKSVGSIESALEKVHRGEVFPDLLAADLRQALADLGEITGEVTSDDLLNHIFAEFCIGK
jgi:tRNA modification GTPase